MQPNKTKLALQIGAVVLGALCASNSYADTFTAEVTTVDDVEITERVALSFGTNVFTTASTSCTMLVTDESTGTANPTPVLMKYASTAAVSVGGAYGDLSGDGCVNATTDTAVTAGVWDITGIPGGSVKILLTEIAQDVTDYTYSPDTGCYVEYNGDNTANADSCVALAPGTVYTTPLAASAEDDAVPAAGSGTSVAGALAFTVGGTISIGTSGLTAETPYDLKFQVDVTY